MRREKHASLLQHNTFGIEARCQELVEYETVGELQTLLDSLDKDKLLHIGAGSNLLFCGDYNGSVLHSCIGGGEIVGEAQDEVLLRVGAGVTFDSLIAQCLGKGLHGLENLSLIPGEVGASAVQNIGAYGAEAKDFIRCVEGVWMKNGKTFRMTNAECGYSYRHSIFKQELRGQAAITHVTFALSRKFRPRLDYGGIRQALADKGFREDTLTAQQLRATIIDIRRQKLPDPAELGNAGSFFMNPMVDEATLRRIQRDYPAVPHYAADQGRVKIPAAWLIEQCGWKGRQMGPAAVHSRQPLVLVNLGGATGQDILNLCEAVSASVEERFGIRLRPEVNVIGEQTNSQG